MTHPTDERSPPDGEHPHDTLPGEHTDPPGELTPAEFVERFPLTTTAAAFLAGAAVSGGVLTGALARKLALRGGPVATAMHRVVITAVPMVRATAMQMVTRSARRAVSRATGRGRTSG